MSIAWKVYVREYFKDKGVVFPPGMFVTQALLTLISEAAVPVAPAPVVPAASKQPDPQQTSHTPVTAPAVPESSAPTEPPPPQNVRIVSPGFQSLAECCRISAT